MIGTITLVGVAMVGSLFAMDAWNSVTFTAAEVKNPGAILPVSLALGTAIVVLLYTLANVAYLRVLPLSGDPQGATAIARGIEFAAEGRVATAVASVIFGPTGAILMAVAILVSTFGCNNGLILAGARIYYAMSKDGLFFRAVGTVNRNHVPAVALVAQCIWASAAMPFGNVRAIAGFSDFRAAAFLHSDARRVVHSPRKRPEMPRPYRAFGYPILPALYIVMAVFLEIQLLRYKPQYTWPGLIIVLLGLPVYALWKLAGKQPARA